MYTIRIYTGFEVDLDGGVDAHDEDQHNAQHLLPDSEIMVHPGGNPGPNLKSISYRCHLILVGLCEI